MTWKIQKQNNKDQLYLRGNMLMKVNGKTMREVVEELNVGKLDLFMKVIGKIIWHMDMVG